MTDELLKVCPACKEAKSLTEYPKHTGKARGVYYLCKPCTRAKNNKYYADNREKVKSRVKEYVSTDKGRATLRKSRQTQINRFPEKEIARRKLREAVKAGKIDKLPCQKCGETKVQGHHFNGYEVENWYDVMWLCYIHHREIHGFLTMKVENYAK